MTAPSILDSAPLPRWRLYVRVHAHMPDGTSRTVTFLAQAPGTPALRGAPPPTVNVTVSALNEWRRTAAAALGIGIEGAEVESWRLVVEDEGFAGPEAAASEA